MSLFLYPNLDLLLYHSLNLPPCLSTALSTPVSPISFYDIFLLFFPLSLPPSPPPPPPPLLPPLSPRPPPPPPSTTHEAPSLQMYAPTRKPEHL